MARSAMQVTRARLVNRYGEQGEYEMLGFTGDAVWILQGGEGIVRHEDSEAEWVELQCVRCEQFSRHASPVDHPTCFDSDSDAACAEHAERTTPAGIEDREKKAIESAFAQGLRVLKGSDGYTLAVIDTDKIVAGERGGMTLDLLEELLDHEDDDDDDAADDDGEEQ